MEDIRKESSVDGGTPKAQLISQHSNSPGAANSLHAEQ